MYVDDVGKRLEEMMIGFTESVFRYKAKYLVHLFKVNASGINAISERQYHCLFIIKYLGINTITDMSRHMGQSLASLSKTLSKMVAGGLIIKDYPGIGQDNRIVYFRLTPQGEEVLLSFTAQVIDRLRVFYTSLAPDAQHLLIGSFREIANLIDSHADISVTSIDTTSVAISESPLGFMFKTLIRMANVLSRIYNEDECIKRGLLTMHRFSILKLVESGMDNIQAIGETMFLSQSNLSIHMNRFLKEGLVEKNKDDKDSRRLHFVVTSCGRELLAASYRFFTECMSGYIDTLDEALKERLIRTMSRLQTIFNREE